MGVRVRVSVCEGSQNATTPATKSALQGSQMIQNATPAKICTLRFTKCCAYHEICTSRFTRCCACHEIGTSRSTKYCTCHGSCKRATCPKVTVHCTCHEIRAPQRSPPCMSKVLHLPRNLHFEVKPLRSLAPFRKNRLEPPRHEVSLAPATKSGHHVRKCARHHNESPVATSTRASPPDSASLRSKCTSRISRGMHVL